MTIPTGFVSPSLPVTAKEYDQSLQERYRNVLRLYFNLLDNQNAVLNEQVSANQTLIWLNM